MFNINYMVNLCVEHDVDFEIWHGNNYAHGENAKNVERAAMLINLNPPVRIDFGDKAHGQQISRIHVSGNHAMTVKVADVIETVKANSISREWKNGKHDDVPITVPLVPAGNGKFSVEGKVISDVTFNAGENGRYISTEVEIAVVTSMQNMVTFEVFQLEPVVFVVKTQHETKDEAELVAEHMVPGSYVSVVGNYVYPNVIESNGVSVSTY